MFPLPPAVEGLPPEILLGAEPRREVVSTLIFTQAVPTLLLFEIGGGRAAGGRFPVGPAFVAMSLAVGLEIPIPSRLITIEGRRSWNYI